MISALIAALRARRGVFVALLTAPIALAVAWWATEPRPRAHWVETGDHYEEFDFTPDGRTILTRSDENLILRDATTGRKSLSLLVKTEGGWEPMSEMLLARSITPDGRTLIGEVGGDGGTHILKIWDLANGRERVALGPIYKTSLDKDGQMEDGPMYANHVRSADGSAVAFTRYREGGSIAGEVWDVKDAKRLASFDRCMPIALSRDGKTVVACDSEDGRMPPDKPPIVRARLVPTGREVLRFDSGWPMPRCTAAISPNGKFLAIATELNLTVWDLERRGEVFPGDETDEQYFGSDVPPWFSPDGNLLFPEGEPRYDPHFNGRLNRGLDLTTSPPCWVRWPNFPSAARTVFSPNARQVVAIETLFGPRTGPGKRLPHPRSSQLWTFDYPSGRQVAFFEEPPWVREVTFSPDGRTLFLGGVRRRSNFLLDLYARLSRKPSGPSEYIDDSRLIDVTTGRSRGVVRYWASGENTSTAVFSPRGDLFAARYYDRANPGDENDASTNRRNVDIWDVPIRSPVWGVAVAIVAALAPPGLGWLARSRRGRGLDSGSGVG